MPQVLAELAAGELPTLIDSVLRDINVLPTHVLAKLQAGIGQGRDLELLAELASVLRHLHNRTMPTEDELSTLCWAHQHVEELTDLMRDVRYDKALTRDESVECRKIFLTLHRIQTKILPKEGIDRWVWNYREYLYPDVRPSGSPMPTL